MAIVSKIAQYPCNIGLFLAEISDTKSSHLRLKAIVNVCIEKQDVVLITATLRTYRARQTLNKETAQNGG